MHIRNPVIENKKEREEIYDRPYLSLSAPRSTHTLLGCAQITPGFSCPWVVHRAPQDPRVPLGCAQSTPGPSGTPLVCAQRTLGSSCTPLGCIQITPGSSCTPRLCTEHCTVFMYTPRLHISPQGLHVHFWAAHRPLWRLPP